VAAAVALFPGGPALAQGEPLRLSMGEVAALTLRNNLSVRTSYLDRVLEKFSLEQAEAKYVPSVNIDGSANLEAIEKTKRMYDDSKDASSTTREVGATASVEQMIPTGATLSFSWENTYADTTSRTLTGSSTAGVVSSSSSSVGGKTGWNLELSQPLLKGAGWDYNMASVRLARISERRNILSLRDSLGSLIVEGINYFFTFVQAKENLEIQTQALERSQRLLEINRLKLKLGRMSQSDVTQAEADVASQELSLEQSRNDFDDARRNLLNHLNLDPNLMVMPVKEQVREVHPELDSCLAAAEDNNYSYLDKVFAVREAEINAMMVENERKWDLSVVGGVGQSFSRDEAGPTSEDTEVRAGLEFSAPINLWGGDYLSRKQLLLQAAADKRRAAIQLKKAETDLQTSVANAVRNVNMRHRFIDLARRNTELKQAQLNNENIKLMAGRTTNFEVVSYQDQLIQAQQDEVSNTISYLQALLDLDQILGTTMETWKVEFKHEDKALERELDDEIRPNLWTWW